ncbi:ribosome biogenesis GTPase RsgA [Caldalkalibacillus thermarum TA2.A1]|uniref:Small ribosomal subunit biogenesis GTPase RsgA n=1 Tax=Caldalkalibacillus thermarum (strain TA2.A1) TaxID=986075 RepID=F5L7U3_CALTT|nr:ribosome small subunit-dependent GTPase A [Caldalkalibacillus thermarum]EGL82602.1 ribosome biogenesis GTPase RsgA [Caldalkalibacillus thermarum TA2.A1]GGK14206.1 putative ribosome biogenesis GTPase RsgA [Caldalkalibacillus thermarum]
MLQGRIIKALAGYYYVLDHSGKVWQCRARGVFKKKGLQPLVGDVVQFESVSEREGWVTQLKDRKNRLVRPPIANVDQALLVFSVKEPSFSSFLLDRMLVTVEKARIRPLICFTKLDLCPDDKNIQAAINVYQQLGYQICQTSSVSGEGIDDLMKLLRGKITVLAGQSGVGKSTLLNLLCPQAELETGEVSDKLGRGRHTTRHVELLQLPGGGLVADTPGFSQLDFKDIEPEELAACFVEFRAYMEACKFRGCLHRDEPGCAVKSAVAQGEIDSGRYTHYLQFLDEIGDQLYRKRY